MLIYIIRMQSNCMNMKMIMEFVRSVLVFFSKFIRLAGFSLHCTGGSFDFRQVLFAFEPMSNSHRRFVSLRLVVLIHTIITDDRTGHDTIVPYAYIPDSICTQTNSKISRAMTQNQIQLTNHHVLNLSQNFAIYISTSN